MKTRKEKVSEFMAQIDGLSMAKLRVACYVRRSQLPKLNEADVIIAALRQEFAKCEDSWIIADIAEEYNRIADMSEHNIQVWANYRRNGNIDESIANLNGEYIDTYFTNITVSLDGIYYTVSQHGVTIENDANNMPISHMQKLAQIANKLYEIKRLVE